MSRKLKVKTSEIDGMGIFAKTAILKTETICKMSGRKVSIAQLKRMYKSGKERIDDPFQIADQEYIILRKPYIYFNHSCSPNAGVRQKGVVFALRSIEVGEEITYDYSTTESTNDKAWQINWTRLWKIKCRCKSRNCKKEIRVFSLLPLKTKLKYYLQGALPDFIYAKMTNSIASSKTRLKH